MSKISQIYEGPHIFKKPLKTFAESIPPPNTVFALFKARLIQ